RDEAASGRGEGRPMEETRTADRRWLRVGGFLLGLLAASACAPKAARRQTEIMEKTGKVGVSAAVLRARMNDLAGRLAGRIEQTADRIGAESPDFAVRRRALAMKADAIPAVYVAAYRSDPLAAAVDVWGFAFQFAQHFESGAGRAAFGLQQPLVQEGARELIADTDAILRSAVTRPE